MSNKEKVFTALRSAGKTGITASAISKKFKMLRKSVMNRISDLRNIDGHTIDSITERNTTVYRLRKAA